MDAAGADYYVRAGHAAAACRYSSLVGDIARRYARDGEPREDAQQAAFLGLVKAINGYDPEAGECFLAYASLTMIGEVKQYFREWL